MTTINHSIDNTVWAFHFLTPTKFQDKYDEHGVTTWYEPVKQPRAYVRYKNPDPGVYVDKTSYGLIRLVAHEIGHIKGLTHRYVRPTTMNFTGFLRWVDTENLVPIAQLIVAQAQRQDEDLP